MNNELTNEEKNAFENLNKESMPGKHLESAIIGKLKSEGLIAKTSTITRKLFYLIGSAAAIVIFIAGSIVGSYFSNPATQKYSYMLVLMEDDEFQPGEPMQMFEDYSLWMNRTMEAGINITGQELTPESVLISGRGDETFLNEASEGRITGYFLLQADTRKQAFEIAKSNPHIKYGGSIQLKQYFNR